MLPTHNKHLISVGADLEQDSREQNTSIVTRLRICTFPYVSLFQKMKNFKTLETVRFSFSPVQSPSPTLSLKRCLMPWIGKNHWKPRAAFRSNECKTISCKVGAVNGCAQGGGRKLCLTAASVPIAKKDLLHGWELKPCWVLGYGGLVEGGEGEPLTDLTIKWLNLTAALLPGAWVIISVLNWLELLQLCECVCVCLLLHVHSCTLHDLKVWPLWR